MKRKRFYIVMISLILIFALKCTDIAFTQNTGESEEPEVPDIGTWTQLPIDHQEIDLSGACMTCHNYKIDATTTATKQMIMNGNKMEKQALWEHIVELLGGGKGSKTMIMATSLHGNPLTTTCGQALDPEKKVMYAFYEIGTEKLQHLKKNPRVSLQWHREWENDFSKVLCVQVRGIAELFHASAKEFKEGFNIYFPTEEKVGGYADATLKEFFERMKENMVMSRITIEQVILFEGKRLKEGLCAYQMWRREDYYNPSSYTSKSQN